MTTKKFDKSSEKYYCNICDYGTSRFSQYTRHLSTPKHKKLTNTTEKVPKSSLPYSCECGKEYKHKTSLYKHLKLCKFNKNEKATNEYKQLFEEMLNQNKVLQETMIEQRNQIKELIPKIGNNNNNRLNLNIFLNENCKDAINIMDFMNSLQITELENTDYVEGITKLIVDELKNMDISKRPLHCSDIKDEIIYVKDNNVWEKDNKDKKIVLKAIEHVDKQIIELSNNGTVSNCETIISNIVTSSDKDKNSVIKNIACEVILPK